MRDFYVARSRVSYNLVVALRDGTRSIFMRMFFSSLNNKHMPFKTSTSTLRGSRNRYRSVILVVPPSTRLYCLFGASSILRVYVCHIFYYISKSFLYSIQLLSFLCIYLLLLHCTKV